MDQGQLMALTATWANLLPDTCWCARKAKEIA